jgi:hypothetical protein
MLWYETDTNTLWKRNEANSAWISMGVFDEGTGTFTPSGGPVIATQAEAEAGTDNTKMMTPLRVAQAIDVQAGMVDYQVFTASGTWTKPSGLSANAIVTVELWAGGGGGGRSATSEAASGGGGGAYATYTFLASSLGATQAVTVGAGGIGRLASRGNGTAGGNSSFSTLVAYGGGAGLSSSGTTVDGANGGGAYVATGVTLAFQGIGYINGSDTRATESVYGGGGSGAKDDAGDRDAGGSVFGGGGGAGQGSGALGGTSVFGGAGGNGSGSGSPGGAGGVRGGGGAAGYGNNGGDGGRGEVRIMTRG